jgi:PAS domain S-box-containing protein
LRSNAGPAISAHLERLAHEDGFDALGFLGSLMHNIPGIIYRGALDSDWTMHMIGDEVERVTGYPATDFLDNQGRTFASVIHPDDRDYVEVNVAAAVDQHEPFNLEYRIVRADGEVRWVLERGQKTVDRRGHVWLDGVIFDITERRRDEALARQREAEAARIDELEASRARIIEASDAARRRIERDLHDGAQQRLVAASLRLRLAHRQAKEQNHHLAEPLGETASELDAGLAELRELARGIHPAVLSDHGLTGAVQALAKRCAFPVSVNSSIDERLASSVELAAYFTVAEALTNCARYARATKADVRLALRPPRLVVEVQDDGCGGATTDGGTGLRGLSDRLQALGGNIVVHSPVGGGTLLRALVPYETQRAATPN